MSHDPWSSSLTPLVANHFYIEGHYYQTVVEMILSGCLDEMFDEPLVLPPNTYFTCEGYSTRSVVAGMDHPDVMYSFVILKTFDPRDSTNNSFIRLGFFVPGPTFPKVNELTFLALATTGLI